MGKATFEYAMLTILVLGLAYGAMTYLTGQIAGSLGASATMIEEATDGR